MIMQFSFQSSKRGMLVLLNLAYIYFSIFSKLMQKYGPLVLVHCHMASQMPYVGACDLDVRKAIDSINHEILIEKIYNLGMTGIH